MIDVLAALQVAEDAAGRQPLSTTFADLRALYGIYASAEASKSLDLLALLTDENTIAMLRRTIDLFATLQDDPKTSPHLDALLASLQPSAAAKASANGV